MTLPYILTTVEPKDDITLHPNYSRASGLHHPTSYLQWSLKMTSPCTLITGEPQDDITLHPYYSVASGGHHPAP